jgi:hypothetical protein
VEIEGGLYDFRAGKEDFQTSIKGVAHYGHHQNGDWLGHCLDYLCISTSLSMANLDLDHHCSVGHHFSLFNNFSFSLFALEMVAV